MPGGSLSCRGDEIARCKPTCKLFENGWSCCVFADGTQNHVFKDQGGPWPVHCRILRVLSFIPNFISPIRYHRYNSLKLAYSAFDDTELAETLKEAGLNEFSLCGLATDVCVKSTAPMR